MLAGLAFTFLTGLIWAAVGIVFSVSVKKGLDFTTFMLLYSALCTLASWTAIPDYAMLLKCGEPRWAELSVAMGANSVLGSAGFLAMRKAMETGRHGVVWTVAQSAMLIPFAAGVLLWGEKVSIYGIAGMLLLAASLPFCASAGGRRESGKDGSPGLPVHCLAAFALIGLSQLLSMIPSHWEGWEDHARLRVPLLFLFSMLFWLGVAVLRMRRLDLARTLWTALAYSVFVLAGQMALYKSLDLMSAANRSAIVYPTAIGCCVGAFFIYSVAALKERPCFSSGLGVAGVVSGIAMTALK